MKATLLWSDPCREVGSNSEASPSSFYSASASQSNLHNLGQMNIVSANRGLNIHDMAMEQSNGQTTYDDSQKKAKLEVNMGFASSNSSGAAAEGAGETFTSQAETQAHGSGSATNWQQQQSHQPHHPHAPQQQQAYASPPQYPSGYFSQVGATSCVDETRTSLNKLQVFLSKVESNFTQHCYAHLQMYMIMGSSMKAS